LPPSRAAARDDGDELWVRAVALSRDGQLEVRRSASGDPADAAGVGNRLAGEMLADGAGQLEDAEPATETQTGMARATDQAADQAKVQNA
jgi:hydroxymethylbilane synthase